MISPQIKDRLTTSKVSFPGGYSSDYLCRTRATPSNRMIKDNGAATKNGLQRIRGFCHPGPLWPFHPPAQGGERQAE